MTFRLYPEERHFWSFNDYAAVLAVMDRYRPETVLEFGPGSSTLALIEGGARSIHACEDHRHWASIYTDRLEAAYPDIVRILPYEWDDPLVVPSVRDHYDLALIDGPRETERRPAVIEFCLQRAALVLVPTEDWRDGRRLTAGYLASVCAELAQRYGRNLTITETGPHAGAFALLC